MRRRPIAALGVVLLLALLGAAPRASHAFPLSGDQTVLPPGTELNEDALDRPPLALHAAEPWSLFSPAVHDAHFAELRRVLVSAQQLQH